jgi:DNA (cytosine-5)-methyltransferase 1
MLRVGSLFAGIGGFDLAAERAGMEVVFQSEIDKYASRVLDHHWPHVKNLGDIHGITDPSAVDVLVGGFPCQSYSVAGKRGGLADDRGALWWEYHRLIGELRPTWVVGENVPGLLSSRGGADFETIIRSLTELGYGVVWAILDAQYFGVAQRRRRVFIVGHSGAIPRPEVLALGEGLFGYPAPSREAGEGVAGTLAPGSQSGGFRSTDLDTHGAWVIQPDDRNLGPGGLRVLPTDVAPTLSATEGAKSTDRGVRIAFAQNQRGEVRDLDDMAGALNAEPGMKQQTYVIQDTARAEKEQVGYEVANNLLGRSGGNQIEETYIAERGPSVRRLTPLECERLQGFPDGWTDIPGNSDTQRYRQLGNAVAVPVAEWIMRRIASSS